MRVETTKLLAATSKPRRGRFPVPLAAMFSHSASGQPLPPRKPSRFCLVSQPSSFWRRAKSCALCSNPAAHVRRRAFPFPVAGDWQSLRSRVPTAARFGGALKRRRNCQSMASSATGISPLGINPARGSHRWAMPSAARNSDAHVHTQCRSDAQGIADVGFRAPWASASRREHELPHGASALPLPTLSSPTLNSIPHHV